MRRLAYATGCVRAWVLLVVLCSTGYFCNPKIVIKRQAIQRAEPCSHLISTPANSFFITAQ